MGTNDEYFASLAQLILATAASQKAEQDRKDELAFRRQQAAESLALQREGLALERDRTQAQIATEEERRKGLSFERDRAERADTVAAIDDSMYRMETGETPAQTKMRLSRKKDEAGVRAAEAQAMMLEGEAENAPAMRDLERRKGEASVKASETQTQAYQQQIANAEEDKKHNAIIRSLAIEEQKLRNEGESIKVGAMRREAEDSIRNRVARSLGVLTPDEQAGLRLGIEKMKFESMFKAAHDAATTDGNGTTFNDDIYREKIAKIENAAKMAGGLGILSKRDPAKFKELQAAASKAAMDIIGSGGSPSVAFAAVRNMVDTVVKTTSPPPPKEPPPPTTAYARGLKMKEEASKKASTEKGQQVIAVLEADPELAASVTESVKAMKRNRDAQGKEQPVTDAMIVEALLDYLPADATPNAKIIKSFNEYAKSYVRSKGRFAMKPYPVAGSPKD